VVLSVQLSIVVPVLNEAAAIADALGRLAPLRARGVEVVVVDGGSDDATVALATPLADRVLAAPRGRARQLNVGARAACGDALLLLHADTILPPDADALVLEALRTRAWGRFDVAIAGAHPMLPVVAASMNARSRLTGIATGDQAMFLTRAAYERIGGVPDLALMEDVALSAVLKRLGPPACLRARVLTSGRRWENGGVLRTILLMWRLRLAFFLGADPARLARAYGYRPADG
jgi:rSAM/selenodomain-associated transferase 2